MLYTYQILLASWGVKIDLEANIVDIADAKSLNLIEVVPGVFLALSLTWQATQSEIEMLKLGIVLLREGLTSVVATSGPFVVNVLDIRYVPTDYQEEGLACAMFGLLTEHFGILAVQPGVRFDNERNRYHFDFSIQS